MGKLNSKSNREQQTAADVIRGKQYIDEVAFAERYDIPVKTLRNWRLLGRGPEFIKFGFSVRYSVRSIEAWVESLPRGGAGVPSSALKSA